MKIRNEFKILWPCYVENSTEHVFSLSIHLLYLRALVGEIRYIDLAIWTTEGLVSVEPNLSLLLIQSVYRYRKIILISYIRTVNTVNLFNKEFHEKLIIKVQITKYCILYLRFFCFVKMLIIYILYFYEYKCLNRNEYYSIMLSRLIF